METKSLKIICPDCGKDITENVLQQIAQHKKENDKRKTNVGKNLQKYISENKEAVKEFAAKASKARTEETFKKQAQTLINTNKRISTKFAELLFIYSQQKGSLSDTDHIAIMKEAREAVKKEKAEENKELRRKKSKERYRQKKLQKRLDK